MKNKFGHFCRITEYDRAQVTFFYCSARYYGNQCASYKIISVTLKRLLKTQLFDKNDFFPPKKIFRPTFSRIIEFIEPRGTKYRGQQAFVTVFVQGIRSFLWDLRCR